MKWAALLLLLTALCGAASAQGRVTFTRQPNRVEVEIDGRPFTAFHYGTEWDKPFLHPLRTVSGVKVTRGYPLEQVAGERADHRWHRGLWYAHGDINGIDFWREQSGDKTRDAKLPLPTGRIVVRGVPTFKGGKGVGTLAADFDLMAPGDRALGTLSEQFTFRRSGASNIIDVQITIVADRGVAVRMGDTEEGSLGLRLAEAFRQDRGATLSNSDGLVGAEKIWGKRASWVDYSATIQDEQAGVTIFDHPQNPKHPTFWHARNYGLCAVNPFGERDFLGDKTRDGGMTIPRGESLTFRYRVVIHNGGLGAVAKEQLYTTFSGGKRGGR
jgi:hypothetical protein